MARMNAAKVIAGGLVGGLVINVIETVMNVAVLTDAMGQVYEDLGIAEPGGPAILLFVVFGFVLGILIAWLYAAIRPRFGPGPRTAVIAAVAVWIAAVMFPITVQIMLNIVPPGLGMVAIAYGLVEFLLAALAAGAIYREGEPAPAL